MAAYDMINGYIEDIYSAKTKGGKEYLGIKFYTTDEHDNESFPEIRIWFTTPNAIEIAQEKVERLYEFAGLEWSGPKPKAVSTALKALSRDEFAALEIPITVQPNEYEGKIRSQYDIGWAGSGQARGYEASAFQKLGDLAKQRIAELKANNPSVEVVSSKPSDNADALYDDIPF